MIDLTEREREMLLAALNSVPVQGEEAMRAVVALMEKIRGLEKKG